jgi:hypothetical protein
MRSFKLGLGVLVFVMWSHANASETVRVLVSCGKYMVDGVLRQVTPVNHLGVLQSNGLRSTKIHSSAVSCSDQVTIPGATNSIETSDFFTLDISKKELGQLLAWRELEFKEKTTKLPPPKNLAELFESFRPDGGLCEYLIPSQFSKLKAADLMPKTSGKAPSDSRAHTSK